MPSPDPAPGRHRRFVVDKGTASQRTAAWAGVMAPSGRVEVPPQVAANFVGEVRSYALGEALATRVAASDFRYVRDQALAGRTPRDMVFVDFVESGRLSGHLGGRKVQVEAGGVFITRRSISMDLLLEGATWYALIYPRSRIERHMAWRPALDAKVFAPGSAPAVLLGHHLRSLMDLPDDLTASAASRVGGQSLRFLLPHLGGSADDDDAEPPAPDELAFSIRRFIADRIGDPELDAAMVCREFALSRSRLYRIFGDGDGVSGIIRRLRLLCVQRDIMAGALADRPLAELAARWGFTEMRTFRRAFVAQFGLTPSRLREQAVEQGGANATHSNDAAAEVERWFEG